MGQRGIHIAFSGNARRKTPLGRITYRWEDNIKMGLREI
jgi:hypothetical protein